MHTQLAVVLFVVAVFCVAYLAVRGWRAEQDAEAKAKTIALMQKAHTAEITLRMERHAAMRDEYEGRLAELRAEKAEVEAARDDHLAVLELALHRLPAADVIEVLEPPAMQPIQPLRDARGRFAKAAS